MDRRTLLTTGVAATMAAGSQFFSGIPALADYAVGPTVRRNAHPMAANDPILRGYRRAIQKMRALPNDNPCSWFYQAAIHGTTDPAALPAWNTCHTDPSFFWAWHRMYLYWFERIVRKQSGMYDWAIPYWDWTNPARNTLPPAFRVSTSLLYEASRNASMNNGTGSISAFTAASVASAMTLLDYFSAQSSMNGPHGSVHGAVGGIMGSVSSAARDPIFWLHHAQVDRLWNLWLAQGGGRSSPIGDATWRNTTYTFFDECCQQVTMKGCDVLRAALQLNYSYEGEPAQVNQYCPLIWNPGLLDIVAVAKWRKPFPLTKEIVRTPLIDPEDKGLGRRLSDIARAPQQNPALRISGIEAQEQPGVSWEVHVGSAGFKPSAQSFVGVFALFGAGLQTRKDHYHPAEFVFPIGKALRSADASKLEVAFVPVSGRSIKQRGAEPAFDLKAPLMIGALDIFVDRAGPQPPRDEQEKLRREEQLQ